MIRFCVLLGCLFGFYLTCAGGALAGTTDSTNALLPSPKLTPMVFSPMTVTVTVQANNMPALCGASNNAFVQVAQCPTGSIYYSPTAPFTGADVYACLNGSCRSGLVYSLNPINWGCTGSHEPHNFISGDITSTVICTLSLEGWFPSTAVTSVLSNNNNNQIVAPASNFQLLPAYTVTYNCDSKGNNCTCTTTGGPNGNGSIPSYGTFCSSPWLIAYVNASFAWP